MNEILELPPEHSLEYFAEGGANIIYRLRPPATRAQTPPIESDLHSQASATSRSTPPPSSISPRVSPLSGVSPSSITPVITGLKTRLPLVRLRKDLAFLPAVTTQHAHYLDRIVPLFPPNTVLDQQLIKLPDALPDELNAALRTAEHASPGTSTRQRPQQRHGTYLPSTADEPHGTAITDLSPSTSTQFLLELKPKWLAQSPTAPPNATRCRTCALRAMRKHGASVTEHLESQSAGDAKIVEILNNEQPGSVCPLDLGSGQQEDIARAVDAIFRTQSARTKLPPPPKLRALQSTLVAHLQQTPLLPRLRELQTSLDPKGVLNEPEPPSDDFLVATTIRDCTLFMCVELGEAEEDVPRVVDARLGDLDLKQPEKGKVKYWKGVERELVEGGWYTGFVDGGQRGAEVGCRLERGRVLLS